MRTLALALVVGPCVYSCMALAPLDPIAATIDEHASVATAGAMAAEPALMPTPSGAPMSPAPMLPGPTLLTFPTPPKSQMAGSPAPEPRPAEPEPAPEPAKKPEPVGGIHPSPPTAPTGTVAGYWRWELDDFCGNFFIAEESGDLFEVVMCEQADRSILAEGYRGVWTADEDVILVERYEGTCDVNSGPFQLPYALSDRGRSLRLDFTGMSFNYRHVTADTSLQLAPSSEDDNVTWGCWPGAGESAGSFSPAPLMPL